MDAARAEERPGGLIVRYDPRVMESNRARLRSAAWAVLGCLASLAVSAVVLMALVFGLISFGNPPAWPLLWLGMGLAPALLILPAAGVCLRLKWRAAAAGLLVGGVIGVAWGSLAWTEILSPPKADVTARAPAPPRDLRTEGILASAEPLAITLRLADGRVQAFRLTPGTIFNYYGDWESPTTPATAALLSQGRRVEVFSVARDGFFEAKRVYLWVEPKPARQ